MKDEKKLTNLDNSIDSILYDLDRKDIKKREDIEEIRSKVAELSINYSNITKSPNMIEFLTQVALNDSSNAQRKSNNKNITLKKQTTETINKLLEQSNVNAFLTEEKDRIERYNDYRIIDSYIPQVSRCIDLYRDCILAPDDLTKKSINIDYVDENLPEDDKSKIEANIKELKEKFKIDKKAKQWIREGIVLGDCFVATLKIDEEINRMMLKENHELGMVLPNKQERILTESEVFDFTSEEMQFLENSFLEEMTMTLKNKKIPQDVLKADFNTLKKDIVAKINNNIIYIDEPTKDIESVKNFSGMAKNFKELKMNGAILKYLEPERTIKLTIDDVCLGYLYIEKYDVNAESGSEGFGMSSSSMLNTSCSCGASSVDYFNSRHDSGKDSTTIKNKLLTDIFVKGISKKLDNKIIEKNQQFKEVIYQLIKKDYLLDKKIKIVYYQPDQVKHYKVDSDDVYGVSKLARIIFFAKIFLATMLTETMQKISRGRDKRVVYVETGLDEDIEGSIQSVVRDIKTKDIQADDLKTITSVFKHVGAFEDYFIPKIDGEVPIDFETISGMDVNVDDDFLQYLLKSIISGIGVPATYTDASNDIDFSRSLVMQNSTFVREIVSKQGDGQEFLTEVARTLYEYEFGPEDIPSFDITKLKVTFPTPEFLNVSNINEQISNHSNTIEFIMNTYFDQNTSDEVQDKKKHIFKREVTKKLVTSIDWDEFDDILDKVEKVINKEDLEKEDTPDNNTFDGDDEEFGGDDF